MIQRTIVHKCIIILRDSKYMIIVICYILSNIISKKHIYDSGNYDEKGQ